MDNYAIADQLNLLSKLMDIHGENAFKSKAYASAAFALEKLPQQVSGLPKEKIISIRGIGESAGNKIIELLETGRMPALQEALAQTPEGVLEMMNIKGLGPKKINTLWKTLSIDSIPKLQEACEENRIATQKGFGEKTQQNILEAIQYQQENKNKYLYAQVEDFAEAMQAKLKGSFPDAETALTGAYRRQLDVVDMLEWVTTIPHDDLKKFLDDPAYELLLETEQILACRANGLIQIKFYFTKRESFGSVLFETTGNDLFVDACKKNESAFLNPCASEDALFKKLELPVVPPALRESADILDHVKS